MGYSPTSCILKHANYNASISLVLSLRLNVGHYMYNTHKESMAQQSHDIHQDIYIIFGRIDCGSES